MKEDDYVKITEKQSNGYRIQPVLKFTYLRPTGKWTYTFTCLNQFEVGCYLQKKMAVPVPGYCDSKNPPSFT